MDNTPKLGQLITSPAYRDAVHIAIVPVVANEELYPGNHVCVKWANPEYLAYNGPKEEAVGIVDPFLINKVNKGDIFYLCLYPNSITSLRHVWTHPKFTIKLPGNL